jgi:hypothetical protein
VSDTPEALAEKWAKLTREDYFALLALLDAKETAAHGWAKACRRAEARQAEAEKERDEAKLAAADEQDRANREWQNRVAAEADRDRLRAFVAKARPLLGMNVPGSLGAEATKLLSQQPTSIGATMRGE